MGNNGNGDRLYFFGLQNHSDGDCSHEKTLAPWKQSCDKLRYHIKKQRYYLAYKGSSSQSCGFFPVVMYRCERWTIKKAEYQRIDAFELWCWRRLLRVPCTERRSNQSILKEISPEYSLKELMLKLKLQNFGHLMWRTDSFPWCWERLKAGGEGNSRGWDGWMASPTQWTWVWASSVNWWWTGKPGVLQSMGWQRVNHNWVTELIMCSSHWWAPEVSFEP